MFLTSSAGVTASPSPMLPVTLSTSFMKRLRREPPSEISPLPPSRIPADNERLNASTESMPSSMVPFATKLMTRTGRVWPMRWMRAIRCSRTAGFHGKSMFTSVEACCRLRPVLPASVDRNTRQAGSSRNRSISAGRFSDGTPPWKLT